MMTTVSSGGYVTDLNNSGASAARKEALDAGMLLRDAFLEAKSIDADEMSIPVLDAKREERVIVNSPEPEYASIKYLTGFSPEERGGKIFSRMYWVNGGRMELLF